MSNPVLVPVDNEPRPGVPKGAPRIRDRHGALVHFDPRASFAECCDRATKGRGRLLRIDFDTVQVGLYDDYLGELRADGHAGIERLKAWTRRCMQRNDLLAVDNRDARRADARRLVAQGRYAEALRRDCRMGY